MTHAFLTRRSSGLPGSGEKYFSNLPSSPLCSSASSGVWSFLRDTLGHCAEKVLLSSSHFSSPLSVSGRIASAGHSGSHTPQSMHSLRSAEHTSELQSLMRISYPVFCLQKKTN